MCFLDSLSIGAKIIAKIYFSIDEYDLRSNQEILDVVFPRFLGLSMEMMANYLRGGAADEKQDRHGDGSIANHFWINTQYVS